MIIGVPTETKQGENRVALTPDGARDLIANGHRVLIESGAGGRSALRGSDFKSAGASLVDSDAAWEADLVVKVKEPQAPEFGFLRPELVLPTFLHLAAYPEVVSALIRSGATAFGYETVTLPNGSPHFDIRAYQCHVSPYLDVGKPVEHSKR